MGSVESGFLFLILLSGDIEAHERDQKSVYYLVSFTLHKLGYIGVLQPDGEAYPVSPFSLPKSR